MHGTAFVKSRSFTDLDVNKIKSSTYLLPGMPFVPPHRHTLYLLTQRNLLTFDTQLKDHFFLEAVPSEPRLTRHSTLCCYSLPNLDHSTLTSEDRLTVFSNRCRFWVAVEEGVGILIPILQMRNQKLRKMKQLPLRSHRLQWRHQDPRTNCVPSPRS